MFKQLNLPHLDDNESVFFARELTYVKRKAYDRKYADIKARTLIPVSSEADPWADAIVYDSYDHVGMAKVIMGYSDDIPSADVKGREFINPVRSIASSYRYSILEIRKAQGTGKPLKDMKAAAAKRAILELENRIAFMGDAKSGLIGLLNHPNVSSTTLPQNAAGNSLLWPQKTPAEIMADMHFLANFIVANTKGVEKPDTLLLPLSAFNYVASTPWSVNNQGETILQLFLKNSQYIKNVDWLNELETAGVGGTRRMVAYRRDPEVLTLEIPQDFEQFDPQPVDLKFKVPCHERLGGVIIYYPLAIAFGDGF
jgi:hypothetical protein